MQKKLILKYDQLTIEKVIINTKSNCLNIHVGSKKISTSMLTYL
jgi:hypothetical protein